MVEPAISPQLTDALYKIVKGIQLLGDGVTILIQLTLAALGLQVPEIAIRIAAIIMVILFIYKMSNVLSKLWIYALVFFLISMFAGLIPAVGEYLSGLFAGEG
jgi:hypothetical protein